MNMNPAIHNLEIMKKTAPSMRYDGTVSHEEWRREAKKKLAELLGMDKFERCDECFSLEHKQETDGYTEYRFTVQSEEGYFFPSTLRVPRSGEGRLENGKYPLIICLQGHSSGAHISLGIAKFPGDEESISGGDRDFAVRAVKEGYAALAVEQRNFGECNAKENMPIKEDDVSDCFISSHTALMLGRTTVGERVWDVSRAIDAIVSHFSDIIETERISLMGNSGGGTATCYAACLEERIKCAMPSCAVCTWDRSIALMYHCSCNFVPRIAEYFDMGDLCAMIAPRGLVVVNGKDDPIFLRDGVLECCEIARKAYTAAGVPDKFAHVEGDGGHRFYADDAWPIFKKVVGDNN